MIKELFKFRAKYPEYNDIEDIELSKLIAAKYPSAYGYLPGKLKKSLKPKMVLSKAAQGKAFASLIKKAAGRGFTVLPGEKDTVVDPMLRTVEVAESLVLTPTACTDILKQISNIDKKWRGAKVVATLEDGSKVDVRAGYAADLITSRVNKARKFAECIK